MKLQTRLHNHDYEALFAETEEIEFFSFNFELRPKWLIINIFPRLFATLVVQGVSLLIIRRLALCAKVFVFKPDNLLIVTLVHFFFINKGNMLEN